jgi:selenocysteine-specific elongation factor
VDRVFTVAGFGTVVTGTLSEGDLRAGQEVEILPAGLKARIRGVSKDELKRGDVITVPGWLEPTQLVDVRLDYLGDAPRALRHNQEVEFYSGAAEVMARARLLGTRSLAPGQSGWVRAIASSSANLHHR